MAVKAKIQPRERGASNRASANNLQIQTKEGSAYHAQDSGTPLRVWRKDQPAVQTKLTVGKANDPFEREADQQADAFVSSQSVNKPAIAKSHSDAVQSVATPAAIQAKKANSPARKGIVQRVLSKAVIPGIQRKLHQAPELQKMDEGGGELTESTASKIKSTSGGDALPPDTRNQMEGHFDSDFSQVRVHTDSSAVQMSQDMGARAFTHGSNIYFNQGEYSPGTQQGNHLLAHELTHTVQQGAAVQRKPQISHDGGGTVRRGLLGRAWNAVSGAVSSAVEWADDQLNAAKDWLLDKVKTFVANIPGYSLLTVVLGRDPITGNAVERNGHNFIAAGLDVIPDGKALKQKLQEEGALAEGAAWLDEQMALLGMSYGTLREGFNKFWKGLSVSDAANPTGVFKKIAGIFTPFVNQIISFAKKVGAKLLEIVKKYLLSKLLQWVKKQTPWYPLLTVALGKDPITGQKVPRNGMNLLKGFISLHPEGKQQLEQMQKSGSLQKAAAWVDGAIVRVTNIALGLRDGFTTMWKNFSITSLLTPIETFGQIYQLFATPVGELISFAGEVARMILKFIKDALIARLVAFAKTIPGYHLLTVILGKDIFSGKPVKRSTENIIRGFMGLMPGGEAKFQDMKKTGAISKMVAWVTDTIAELDLNWPMIKALFTQAWNSLSLADLIAPIAAFRRMVDLFAPPIGRLFRFVGKVIFKIIEIVLGLMGFPFQLIGKIMANAQSAYNDIKRDPIAFLKNLLRAVKQGFAQFFQNILKHLLKGIGGWLFGQLGKTGITIPKDFSFKSIFGLVIQILGITKEKILEKLKKKVGPEKWAKIEKVINTLTGVWSFVSDVMTRGPIAIWEKIQEKLSNLWDTIIGAARNWIMTKIVEKVTVKLLSMLDPTGVMAVVNSFIAFFKAVQSAIEYMIPILQMIEKFTSGVAQIAKGNIKKAADFLEATMSRGMPIMIGFLANQVGLGGIGDKVKEIIKGIQQKVDEGIQWIIDKAWEMGKNLLLRAKAVASKILNWWRKKKPFINKAGEKHTLLIKGGEKNPKLLIRSDEQQVTQYLTKKKTELSEEITKHKEHIKLLKQNNALPETIQEWENYVRLIQRDLTTTQQALATQTNVLEKIDKLKKRPRIKTKYSRTNNGFRDQNEELELLTASMDKQFNQLSMQLANISFGNTKELNKSITKGGITKMPDTTSVTSFSYLRALSTSINKRREATQATTGSTRAGADLWFRVKDDYRIGYATDSRTPPIKPAYKVVNFGISSPIHSGRDYGNEFFDTKLNQQHTRFSNYFAKYSSLQSATDIPQEFKSIQKLNLRGKGQNTTGRTHAEHKTFDIARSILQDNRDYIKQIDVKMFVLKEVCGECSGASANYATEGKGSSWIKFDDENNRKIGEYRHYSEEPPDTEISEETKEGSVR